MSRSGNARATLCAAAIVLLAPRARADEPRQAGEPRMLSEPGEVTNVIDAFDGDDVFDLHLTLGYQYAWKRAHIRRETTIGSAANPDLSTGGFTASNMNVATYEENTSRLNTRADIGLYKDIALFFRMPIILSNDRKLTDLEGSAGQQNVVLAGGPGDAGPLFSLPFNSPQRSGVEYIAAGLDFGLMNQYREPAKPTWIAGFEARFSVGEPMRACNDAFPATRKMGEGQVRCAHPSDVNRSGYAGDFPGVDEGNFSPVLSANGQSQALSPGITRGTTSLELHSTISKRIKYIEPYTGFRALFEFPNANSAFGSTDLKGALVSHPPLQGWIYAGLQVIPWEVRESFQRITFDARLGGSYRSEGRDYSELFDALGSSSASSLRRPTYATYKADPANPGGSIVDTGSQRVYFTGITDISAYASIRASLSVTWQAGEYIKFTAGGSFQRDQSHIITADQSCNSDFSGSVAAAGPCRTQSAGTGGNPGTVRASGIPNPHYRPTIDAVGRRFKADDTNLWDAWIMGIVMF
ncbi:MAG: hypothetical protein ABW133_03505 [Polyangiaceae bacterium]